MKNISPLREKYRLEWENIGINLLNSGWGRSDAQIEADERIEERDDLADYNANEANDYRDE